MLLTRMLTQSGEVTGPQVISRVVLLSGDCATLDHVEFVSVYKDLDLIV